MCYLFAKLLVIFSISMYIMCVILCLFSALSHRVGAFQISIIIKHIINSRLTAWAGGGYLLTDVQAGFRKGRSTIDRIFTLHAAIEKANLQIIQSCMWYLLISRKHTIL